MSHRDSKYRGTATWADALALGDAKELLHEAAMSIPRNLERQLVLGRRFPLDLCFVPLDFFVDHRCLFHGPPQNWAASVDPSSAVVDDWPLLITFITSSK